MCGLKWWTKKHQDLPTLSMPKTTKGPTGRWTGVLNPIHSPNHVTYWQQGGYRLQLNKKIQTEFHYVVNYTTPRVLENVFLRWTKVTNDLTMVVKILTGFQGTIRTTVTKAETFFKLVVFILRGFRGRAELGDLINWERWVIVSLTVQINR